jgi:hypothetical protein
MLSSIVYSVFYQIFSALTHMPAVSCVCQANSSQEFDCDAIEVVTAHYDDLWWRNKVEGRASMTAEELKKLKKSEVGAAGS